MKKLTRDRCLGLGSCVEQVKGIEPSLSAWQSSSATTSLNACSLRTIGPKRSEVACGDLG
jgi:hypothetical protein